MKIDFSQGRAIGTICEYNSKGQYRMAWKTDCSVKLSEWQPSYEKARKQAMSKRKLIKSLNLKSSLTTCPLREG